jgi:hypothetical protein
MIWTLVIVVVLAALGVGAWFVARKVRHRALVKSLDYELLLIRIPKDTPPQGPESELKFQIGKTEQLFAGLAQLKTPFTFEVAVPHIGEEIHFYIGMPREYADTATKQVQSLWPQASVTVEQNDYNVFAPNGAVSGVYAVAREAGGLPIRTYAEAGNDTFASILGAFSNINAIGEGAALQLVVYPAAPEEKKRFIKIAEGLKEGKSLKDLSRTEILPKKFSDVAEVFNPKVAEAPSGPQPIKTIDQDLVQSFEAKLAKPLFWVNMRLIASAPTPRQAETILGGFLAALGQFTAPRRNELKVVKPRNPMKLAYAFSFRSFDYKTASILSAEELASVFHFPILQTQTPGVKWLKSREAPPPPNAPMSGLKIGESMFRGEKKPIYITEEDRRRHIYIVGQTGTGKSTLLGNLILSDIQSGKGVGVIDPHGELVEAALGHIPKERLDDLIYFNPGDLQKPIGLNMLDYNLERPEEKTFIVNEMLEIFGKLYDLKATGGPMFEQYMRNALLLLMEDMATEPATLVEVPRIFTDPEWRKKKLARIHNPVVVDFWEKEAAKAGGDASLANMTPYITSKFNSFIANDYMRPIIGQPKSAFNFREVMDSGKILLVNLSKGRIGDLNANLLGMIVTGRLLMAALSRTDSDAQSRRDFNLYIDEFQNFTTDSISTILSEARKYRLTLTVAHQFIAQLTEKVRDAIFGNVGNQIVMRVGVPDAEFLVKYFDPIFTQNDLTNIDNLLALARIMINGETSPPFNIAVGHESWVQGDQAYKDKLKEYVRLKFGADRHLVEEDITRRLRN